MDSNNRRNPGMKNNWRTIIMLAVAATPIFITVSSTDNYLNSKKRRELPHSEFVQVVETDEVDSIKVDSTEITVTPKKDSTKYSQNLDYYVVRLEGDYDFVSGILDNNVTTDREKSDSSTLLLVLLNCAVPFLLLLFLMNFVMKRMGGGGIMSVSKSNVKMCVQREIGIAFKDAAGEDETKESLIEIADFLHNPNKYTKIGAKLSERALLVGPPGTGGILLARTMAGETRMPFYPLSDSDFVEVFVGVGTSHVRGLLKNATESASCIIFIDEIDAIGYSRDSRMGGSDGREQTLNQLPSKMDGFDLIKGFLVLGATNRLEVLDPTLLRPGRFDRHVVVDKPDFNGRINILKIHSKDVFLDKSVDFEEIVLVTSGAVGVDLVNMMNETAINVAGRGRSAVSQKNLFGAVEVVLTGKEKGDRIMSREGRRIVPYREVGHALVSALQKHSEPVQKITIVPRTMGAPGHVMNVSEEKKYLNTKKELEARLVELMAGRAAGEIVSETTITRAANGIRQATSLARAMATQYGMSDKFGLMGFASQGNQYPTGRAILDYGDVTAAKIDQEIMKILKDSYDEVKRLLSGNKNTMDQIAAFPIDRETITGKELVKTLRKVRGIPGPEETREDEDKVRAS